MSSGETTAKIGVDYSIPLPWPQDRPPDKKFLQDITNEEHRVLKRGRKNYENRVIKWSGEFWIGLGGIPRAELGGAQRNKRVRADKGDRNGAKLGVEYFIPLPWPQYRPPDEQVILAAKELFELGRKFVRETRERSV